MTKGMFMIFKIFRKKFYLDKTAYMLGVPQSGGPSINLIKIKILLILEFFFKN
jgi:hypothetical protein